MQLSMDNISFPGIHVPYCLRDRVGVRIECNLVSRKSGSDMKKTRLGCRRALLHLSDKEGCEMCLMSLVRVLNVFCCLKAMFKSSCPWRCQMEETQFIDRCKQHEDRSWLHVTYCMTNTGWSYVSWWQLSQASDQQFFSKLLV